MLKNISIATATFLQGKSLEQHIKSRWVFNKVSFVLDFEYKGVRFAFDFTPSERGAISLDICQRNAAPEFWVTPLGGQKERIAHKIPMDQALDFFYISANRVLSKIDEFQYQKDLSAESLTSLNPERPQSEKNKRLRSMKVGVLTLPLWDNIGGVLQAFALIETLKQMGHFPVLINRQPNHSTREIGPEEDAKLPLMVQQFGDGKAPTANFISKHIAAITKTYVSSSQLQRNIERHEFDAIVVGSDQVWRPLYAKAILPDFFLAFRPESDRQIRHISYAASFGAETWEYDAEQSLMAKSLIGRFDALSVREDSAVKLCRDHLGAEAKHVLDPTMLLTADRYAELFASGQRAPANSRLLAYVLDAGPKKAAVVETLSKKLASPAYMPNGQPFGTPSSSNTTVEDWLAAFHDATFVVTDSFHGMVFSILFNRPFVAYCNPDRGLARFTSLAKMFGLEHRLVFTLTDFDPEKLLQPIDWTIVNARLAAWRTQSTRFLVTALLGKDVTSEGAEPDEVKNAEEPTKLPASAQVHRHHPLSTLCTGCGVCVSESRGALAMGWDEDGFLVPHARSNEIPDYTIRVCPFNPSPERAVQDEDALGKIFLADASKIDPRGGRFENAYIGYSKSFRASSSSGGIASYVFTKLLESRRVEYLYVVQSDGGSGYKYSVCNNPSDILRTSKTKYFPVTLEELFERIENTEGRVAVSGVACFIKALRLKQYYRPELKNKIHFLVGIICGGLKSRHYTDFLAQSAGIPGQYKFPEYRVKNPKSNAYDYSFAATDEQSRVHQVRMNILGDMWGTGLFKSKACDFCTDLLTELADISVGDAWLPDYQSDGLGNSVIVARSKIADHIICDGLASGELVINEVNIERVIVSQSGGVHHKLNAAKFRMWICANFTKYNAPSPRSKLMKDSPIAEMLVQVHRERTRSKSLIYWKENRNVKTFNARMRSSLKDLHSALTMRQNAESLRNELLKLIRGEGASHDRHVDIKTVRWLKRKLQDQSFAKLLLNLIGEQAPSRAVQFPELGSGSGIPARENV